MSDRPFHHGNLRAALLDQAEKFLRERDVEALSLRELARAAGVSHGAPRRHFPDRRALLDALAERGFRRLADDIHAATAPIADDYASAIRAAGGAFITFAVEESALFDLMFAAKVDSASPTVTDAAVGLFAAMAEPVIDGARAGAYLDNDVSRLSLALSAAIQGIATMLISRRLSAAHGSAVLDDAVTLLLSGASTRPWTRRSQRS